MKTRILLFLAVAAVLTLSFTFITVTKSKPNTEVASSSIQSAPIGGFVLEDEIQ